MGERVGSSGSSTLGAIGIEHDREVRSGLEKDSCPGFCLWRNER